jgi:hypothetical protein
MRLRDLFRGLRARHAQLDEELQSRLRMAIRDRIERGEDPARQKRPPAENSETSA